MRGYLCCCEGGGGISVLCGFGGIREVGGGGGNYVPACDAGEIYGAEGAVDVVEG